MRELQALVMKQAKEKGFGTSPKDVSVPEKIALIHSEVTEAYEAYRHKRMDGKHGFREELGDIVQRVLHLAGVFKINVEREVLKKLHANKTREWQWDDMNEHHL